MSELPTTVAKINRPKQTDRVALPPALLDVTVFDPTPALYLLVEYLPPLVRPAHLVRHHGVTLVYVHPEALRVEVAFWVREHLDAAERLLLREAYGLSPDLAAPPVDEMLEGDVSSAPIPMLLRLPDAVRGAMSA